MTEQAAAVPELQKQADARARAATLRSQAAALEASIPVRPGVVRLKVHPPHESFSFGSAWVGNDWTEVGEHMVPAVMTAASEAGVTITQQEG